MEIWIIGGAALLTAVLSAVAGLGGGVILLAVIAQFFAPTVAIPIQGGIQFVANGSRALRLRPRINWSVVAWTVMPMVPAAIVGATVASLVPAAATRLVLGVFLLVLVWRPQLLRFEPAGGLSNRGLLGVGAASGFLNATVGASGPFTSPFLRAVTASHAAFVATAAASQVFAHVSKLIGYGLNGFDLVRYLPVIGVGAAGAVVGTLIGTRLLGSADEVLLGRIFRTVLTVLAIRLVYIGAAGLIT